METQPNSAVLSQKSWPVPAKAERKTIKVALVSCGLGRIKRGVEASTARWYERLKNVPELEVRLFSGGQYPEATKIDNIPRDTLLKSLLKPVALLNGRRTWEFCYGLEQITFAAGFGSTLLSWQPDIVWTKETPFAHVLSSTRAFFQLKYKLIFSNGCGFEPATYAHLDFIQHLHQESFAKAEKFGIAASKMTVLPNLMPVPRVVESKSQCKELFGLKPGDWVITCAAAWNRHHKRIDYLIKEVAKLNDPTVQLLLCGQPETDTQYLKQLAAELLPGRVQWHTLKSQQVPKALKAADVFVLPSLEEYFGGVIVEAMMLGIPVISHQTSANRQFASLNLPVYDLSLQNNLAGYLAEAKNSKPNTAQLEEISLTLKQIYDENKLASEFVNMVKSAMIQ